jgi:lipopolysaccharide export system protein LptA
MWISFLLLKLLLIGAVSGAHSAEPGSSSKNGEVTAVPTTITAKKVTVRKQDSRAVFEGTVVLTRGPLLVYSDKMIVLFHAQGNGAAPSSSGRQDGGQQAVGPSTAKENDASPTLSHHSVNRVEAIDHVKIKYASGNATCQKAVYFSEGDKIVLTGDPVAWEKGTRVSGKQITIYLAEERSVVEGDSHVRIEGEGKTGP